MKLETILWTLTIALCAAPVAATTASQCKAPEVLPCTVPPDASQRRGEAGGLPPSGPANEAIIGLDLRVLAYCWYSDSPDTPHCDTLASYPRHRRPSPLTNPWAPADGVTVTGRTVDFLERAAELWDEIESPSPALPDRPPGLRQVLLAKGFEIAGETATSFLVRGDYSKIETAVLGIWRGAEASMLAPLVATYPNGRIESEAHVPSCLGSAGPIPKDPNDPLLHAQHFLVTTNIYPVWQRGITGSPGDLVAILDSGFDDDQKDLPDPKDADTSDHSGHGTAVAGIVGAISGNGYRVAGVSSDSSLLNYKMLGVTVHTEAHGTSYDAARALYAAADAGAVVVSAAWGGRCVAPELWNAILYAQAKDVLVIAAAGNDQIDLDTNPEFFPAAFRHRDLYCQPGCPCLDNLLVVGATATAHDGSGEKRASFSNHGTTVVQLGAPGVGITTTGLERKGGVVDATGTSAATALVVGAAALVAGTLSHPHPNDRFEIIRDRLLDGAVPVGRLRPWFENGRLLNICRAVFPLGTVQPDPCDVCLPPE